MFNAVSKLIIIFGGIFTNHKNSNSAFNCRFCSLITIYLVIILSYDILCISLHSKQDKRNGYDSRVQY